MDLACLFERRQTDALLVASVGIWTQTHIATAPVGRPAGRGAKTKPVPGPHLVYDFLYAIGPEPEVAHVLGTNARSPPRTLRCSYGTALHLRNSRNETAGESFPGFGRCP